ncbi:hypothetical protein [Streptomyces avermitilis]|uniref:hypothetical protein n=1 Tax=Streptomyces avermitilis TaxID=33903 RepID=UPI0033B87BEE
MRPGPGRAVAAVAGLVVAPGLGAVGQARAAPAAEPTAEASRWSDRPRRSDADAGAATRTITDCRAGTPGGAPQARCR